MRSCREADKCKHTMASKIKSVAALMPPAIKKNLMTLIHRAPGIVPANVVQNPDTGMHWKMQTNTEDSTRQAVKTAHSCRMRRYWTMGKIRYWNKMMENFTEPMAKI